MARINVDDYAFDDPRFAILAGALRCLRDRWHALGRCLRIWHLCASRRTDTVRPVELAECLGVRKPLTDAAQKVAVEAFVTTANLGEWHGDVIRVRGTKGRTDYLDRMDDAKTLPERILGRVQANGPTKRSELFSHFPDDSRSTFYRVVKQLINDGELACDGHYLSIPQSSNRPTDVPRESQDNPENVPGPSRDAVLAPAPVPALAPDPVPAPAERANRAHAPARPTGIPSGSPTDVSRESHETNPGETISLSQAALAAERRDIFSALYQHWNNTGRAHCPDWRSPGELAGRHRVREALNHPELAGRSEADIRHGLAMLYAECAERARLKQSDPWRWYRQAWRPAVLSMACDVPCEDNARHRARKATGKKQTTWLDEVNAEIAAKERASASP